MDDLIFDMAGKYFKESIETKNCFLSDPVQMENLVKSARLCVETYQNGNKILIAGNGGSAADAQHFAGELVSRFNFDRPPLAAIALTTDTSIITAIGNDYGYEDIFSRQIIANGKKGDLFVGISTSGKSKNILKALDAAKKTGLETIALLGKNLLPSEINTTISINVPSNNTPHTQEVHEAIIHIICMYVEYKIFSKKKADI